MRFRAGGAGLGVKAINAGPGGLHVVAPPRAAYRPGMTPLRSRQEPSVGDLVVSEWSGSGPTVVGLAGLGSSGRTWGPLADALGDRHVVAPHLRGRGGSAHLTGPAGLRGHARDVAAVLTELDLQDVVVVGHSMGAYLAPLVAQEAAGRVTRLVLVDGGVPPRLPFFMGPRMTRIAFGAKLKKLDKDWASIDALADKHLGPMLKARPDLRGQLVHLLAQDFR